MTINRNSFDRFKKRKKSKYSRNRILVHKRNKMVFEKLKCIQFEYLIIFVNCLN